MIKSKEISAMKKIACICTDFPEKFGIPRQSGMVETLKGVIVFEPEFRNPDALRGIEEFTHIWLIWEFSESVRDTWSATVRPPRLGGNVRKGVFATRSPFRPNPVGLSCVKLDGIRQHTEFGWVLDVSGADLMDGTPIYDIKPYLPLSDCHPKAGGGFSDKHKDDRLTVAIPKEMEALVPSEKRSALKSVLALDPRPSYQEDPERIYGLAFAGMEIKFQVAGYMLTVCEIRCKVEA